MSLGYEYKKKHPPFSEKEIRKVREVRKSGGLKKEAAKKIGVSMRTLLRYCNKFPRFRRAVEGPKITKDSLLSLYRDGWKLKDIADYFWVSVRTIRRRLREIGASRREHQPSVVVEKSKRVAKAVRYARWALAEHQKEFAQRFGVSRDTVSNVECGRSGVTEEWAQIQSRSDLREVLLRKGVSLERPKRKLSPNAIPDLLHRLRLNLSESWVGLSDVFGVSETTPRKWAKGQIKPDVKSHKLIRDKLEEYGIWQPNKVNDCQTEGADHKVDLSPQDRRQIRALIDSGTGLSDVAMMYGIEVARVRRVLKGEEDNS